MKKVIFSLMAMLCFLNMYAQRSDSLQIYGKGILINSFLLSKVESITFEKTGVDGKQYPDYVTQMIRAAGKNYPYTLSNIDSLKIKIGTNGTDEQLVDLGLSVKWAGWNIGASSPEGYGSYFAWGETKTKDNYSKSNYQWYKSESNSYIHIGGNISDSQFDVAHAMWGNGWRMPTSDEINELLEKCTQQWIKKNGVSGKLFTGPSGKSIFLPAGGYRQDSQTCEQGLSGNYWSANVNPDDEASANEINFNNNSANNIKDERSRGFSIRAVAE